MSSTIFPHTFLWAIWTIKISIQINLIATENPFKFKGVEQKHYISNSICVRNIGVEVVIAWGWLAK